MDMRTSFSKETGILVSILFFFIILFAFLSAAPEKKHRDIPNSSDAAFQGQLDGHLGCKSPECLAQVDQLPEPNQVNILPWEVPVKPVKPETTASIVLAHALSILKLSVLLCILSSIAYAMYYYLLRYIFGTTGLRDVPTALFVRGYLVMLGTILAFSGLFVLAGQFLIS